jgi:hypothetical protein
MMKSSFSHRAHINRQEDSIAGRCDTLLCTHHRCLVRVGCILNPRQRGIYSGSPLSRVLSQGLISHLKVKFAGFERPSEPVEQLQFAVKSYNSTLSIILVCE